MHLQPLKLNQGTKIDVSLEGCLGTYCLRINYLFYRHFKC